jgi:outer membrane protein TolC
MTHDPSVSVLSIAALAFTLTTATLSPTFAETPLTPDAAAAIAVANHPLIRAATREGEGAQADRRLARSGWLPRLDLTEDYARSTNPVFVFAAKLGQERFSAQDFAIAALNTPDPYANAATRVSLSQNVWDGGRTAAAGRAAKLGVEAAGATLSRTRDEIAFGAKRAFWDVVLSDEMVAAARDAEKAAAANFELAGKLVDEGIAVPSDRMQADVRLGEVRAMRVRAEQTAIVARAALRRALSATDAEEFTLDAPEISADDVAPEGSDPGATVVEALAARTDLRAFDARIGQAQQGETIALSGRLPQIGLGAQYEWNGTQPFDPSGNNWTVGAFVRIPLYDGCEGLARRQRAEADRLRLEAMRDAYASGVDLEIRGAAADRTVAAERLRMAESNAALSLEALRIVRERYGEGLATIVELLGVEASATQARASKAQATRDLAVSGLAFDLAAGRPLAPPPTEVAEKE